MSQNQLRNGLLVATLLAAIFLWPQRAAAQQDWPAYGGDIQHSHVTEQTLPDDLALYWSYTAPQPPAPAWPEPKQNLNRTDFDYAFQPVVAQGQVYFGSSADDTLRALDLVTGEPQWRFTAGGPIRFAPQVVGDRLYFGADDGRVYCLEAQTGKLVWQFYAGPYDQRLVANGRMIGRWPIRTGVVVDQGSVYFAAGVWASEGIFVYSLDAGTGAVKWCNDTSHALLVKGIHKATSITGVSPQGPILATDDLVLVPTGRSVPAAYERDTGRLRYYLPIQDHNGRGGSWVGLNDDRFFVYAKSFYSPLAIDAFELATGQILDLGIPRPPQISEYVREEARSIYDGQVRTLIDGNEVISRASYRLVKAGNVLIEGRDDQIAMMPADSENPTQTLEVEGQVHGLAIAGGRLIASTDAGVVYCFGPADGAPAQVARHSQRTAEPAPVSSAEALSQAIDAFDAPMSYALVLGASQADFAARLAAARKTRVVLAVADPAAGQRIREQLVAETDLYGQWLDVHVVAGDGQLPFAAFFASLVVLPEDYEAHQNNGSAAIASPEEAYRVLHPYGGRLLMPGDWSDSQVGEFIKAAGMAEEAVATVAGFKAVMRGALPGALNWDSDQHGDDYVGWPMRLLWYGGPGPARMFNRKHRALTLTFADGAYFVMGMTHLIAVDAYNGHELWAQPIEDMAVITADSEHVYATIGHGAFADNKARDKGVIQLDARTGKPLAIYGPVVERWPQWAKRYLGLHAGATDQLPDWAMKWRRQRMTGPEARGARQHPLTDIPMPRGWLKAFGCSGVMASGSSAVTRSGQLAIYDFEDDSGMRAIPGLRPSCGQSFISALGLWIINEGSAGCECTYNFQSSLALAPTKRRLNEDWALFGDWHADTLIRQAALNLGAPGDRRSDVGTLWLGYPRPHGEDLLPKTGANMSWLSIPGVWQQKLPLALPVPAQVEGGDAAGPYRVNADRVIVANTDQPWLYGSGWTDVRRIAFHLDPRPKLVSEQADDSINLDGQLDEATWQQGSSHRLDLAEADLKIRHDDEHLYVAMRREPQIDRRGEFNKWNKSQTERDRDVWRDDSFEIFLSNPAQQHSLHLAVSASGAAYDGHQVGQGRDNKRWDDERWQVAVKADEEGFVAEFAIPWAMLADHEITREQVMINLQANRRYNVGQAVVALGAAGRDRCESFVPLGLGEAKPTERRRFEVVLHFAELDEAIQAGDRVFDIIVQGQPFASSFDIVQAAGGVRRAVVKHVRDVEAAKALTVEFKPSGSAGGQPPILSAIMIHEQRGESSARLGQ